MNVLVPAMLWLLPLAATPVVFHLFLRLRRQTRVFPSLQFFLAADPHLHARRRIREWLVLALRCAVLALLILALSRPQWRGAHGGGDVAAVWIVDNSASMSTTDREGRSRLQRAVAAARALADDADVRRGGIVATAFDPAVTLPTGLTPDRSVWHAGLDAIRPTHAAGRPAAAVAQALAWLAESMTGIAELHVFTDAQAAQWGASKEALAVPSNVRLVVHRIGDAAERAGDVGLEGLVAPRRRPIAGRAWPLEAHLRNTARAPREIILNVAQAGATEPLRRTLSVPAEGSVRVPVPVRIEGGNEAQVRVWLEGDAAAFAAEGWVAAAVTGGDPVWLVGEPKGFGLLAEAVSPGGDSRLSGLRAEGMSLAGGAGKEVPVARRDARCGALCALVGRCAAGTAHVTPTLVAAAGRLLADVEVAAAVREYVEAGGTVLVAPSAVDGSLVLPEWAGVQVLEERRSSSGVGLVAQTHDAALWDDLRRADGSVRLPTLRASRWRGLTLSEAATPLLGTDAGETVLAVRTLGAGRLYVAGIAWTPEWSDLPRRAAFLALVQSMALAGLHATPTVRAGDESAWRALLLENGTNGSAQATAVAGDSMQAEGRVVSLPAPVRAGVYRVTVGTLPRTVSIVGDSAEAASALMDSGSLPWPAVSDSQVLTHRGAVETLAAVRRGRQGRSLFGLLVTCAVLCALAETWLAQRPATSTGAGDVRISGQRTRASARNRN